MRGHVRKATEEEVSFLRAILNHQLGEDIAHILIPEDVMVKVSPATGRIREIYLPNGVKIASIRASSFTFLLTIDAAKIIKEKVRQPRLRTVVVNEISRDLLENPTNVFARHVLSVDENLRAGDETIVVNEDDGLLCVGRLNLSPYEVLHFIRGVAVKVRECVRDVDS